LVNEEINVPVSENIIVNTLSDVNACKCLTDIDEVQDQESNIGVCLKNQAETTKSIGLVSARPETEKPVSEADNIKDTDKDEDNMTFTCIYIRQCIYNYIFRNGNIYFLINQLNIKAFIIYISGLLLAAGLDLN
jgi:hypothetical protein